MASIVVLNGVSRGNYVRLDAATVTIGRDEQCDVQVLDDHVSRRHLEVSPQGDGYVLSDVGANRAQINRKPVNGPTTLANNDVIVIGESQLVYTDRDVHDTQSALTFAAHGQRYRPTIPPEQFG